MYLYYKESKMKHKIIFLVSLCFLVFLLNSCTTYQSATKGFTGGYTDIPTEYDDIIGVKFSGNGVTSQSAINTFMLMRIADLAKQRGYTNFYLLDSSQNVETSIESYTYNKQQTASSNVSGWANGNFYTGTVKSTYSVPTTQYYSVSKARSGGIAVLTNTKIEELAGKPFYNSESVYKEGENLNNRNKFWNYTQIGYTYTPETPFGFQYGLFGGWLYGSFSFYVKEPDFKGHYKYSYISPSYGDTFTGTSIMEKKFNFSVGTQIPIIKNLLYIPIGVGAQYEDKFDLYDEHYTYMDSYSWYKTETITKYLLEAGVMGKWKNLYSQALFRFIDTKPSFCLILGFIFDEL